MLFKFKGENCMNTNEELGEAEYVSRGDCGEISDMQCGFGCIYSHFVNCGCTDKEECRICKKFGIRAGDYDSCKYYDDSQYANLDYLHNISLFR